MSYNHDDLNRVFTPEGRDEAMQRAYDVPYDWDGRSPVAPPADSTQQRQPPGTPAVEQQPDQPEPGEYPYDPRVDQARQMLQGVFAENQTLRQQQEWQQQQQAQLEQAAFDARIQGLEQQARGGDMEAAATAIQLIQQRSQTREQTLQQFLQQTVAEYQQREHRALVTGFTSEIVREHPRLTDQERDLLETIPDPDNRAAWADYFEAQHESHEQMARQQGATIHAASGAGLVGGNAPAGGASGPPNGRQSSYEVIRNTGWQTING